MTRPGHNKNQWGEWLNDFEADTLKWLESNAWYCRPGPSSGKMEHAFNNYGDEDAGDDGDCFHHCFRLVHCVVCSMRSSVSWWTL